MKIFKVRACYLDRQQLTLHPVVLVQLVGFGYARIEIQLLSHIHNYGCILYWTTESEKHVIYAN